MMSWSKKFMVFAVLAISIFMFSACSNNVADDALEQGVLSMAASDYQTALNYLNLAKENGSDNDELDDMIAILDNYLKSKQALEEADIDSANEAYDAIPPSYIEYTIASDIKQLRQDIDTKNAVMGDVNSGINTVKSQIASGDYTNAETKIAELYTKELTEYQKIQIDELNSTLKAAQGKISEAENKEPDVVYVQSDPGYQSYSNTVVATYYVVNCKQSITLRTSPSTSASEITQIPLGQAVGYIENASNGFYKINYDGKVGYALAAYLSSTKQSSSSSSSSSSRTAQVVNANEYITLRSSASTSASEITKIPAGAYVKYISSASNGFYYVEYNGMRGYALASYLQLK